MRQGWGAKYRGGFLFGYLKCLVTFPEELCAGHLFDGKPHPVRAAGTRRAWPVSVMFSVLDHIGVC